MSEVDYISTLEKKEKEYSDLLKQHQDSIKNQSEVLKKLHDNFNVLSGAIQSVRELKELYKKPTDEPVKE